MSPEPLRVIEGEGPPRGWEALWPRDVWFASELPHGDLASRYRGDETLRFERISQPWLKEAAKRWTRARLLSDTAPRTISAYLVSVRHFSQWLAERASEVSAPASLPRAVLEDYMLWVRHETDWKPATRNQRLLAVRLLLLEQAEDGLAGLPRGAVIHGSELPCVDPGLPKTIADDVFAQWIDPANLARLDERDRTLVLVLAFTGLRVSSVVTLMRDALEHGPDKHPYLRYVNVKSSREALLPIPSLLAGQLKRLESYLAEWFPQTKWLFPSAVHRSATRGAFHINPSTVANVIDRYVRRAEIRTANGELALDVHPHLFRHHLGTSMVNENIPLPVIAQVLDHGSMQMTARYARLHDQTIKREVTRWHQRVNIRGERIALPVDGPLEEAAWMKERIARAKQALPNGYCGLPLQQTCPHPNACLTCESFLTDGSFRAVHEQQRSETRRLLTKARTQGNARLIEMLERDEHSLARILDGLEAIDPDHADDASDGGSVVDLRDLADHEQDGA
jgi:site-specific recombinase XerD/ferredoxin